MPRLWLLALAVVTTSCSIGAREPVDRSDAFPCAVQSICGGCISEETCNAYDSGSLRIRGTTPSDPVVPFGGAPALGVAVGGTYELFVDDGYGPADAIEAEIDGAAEIVAVGTSTITGRGVARGGATLKVRPRGSTRVARLPLRVAEVARVEVGLPELLSLDEAFVSRSVVAGGRAVVQVHLFDARGGRLADMGLRSASSTTAWSDVATRWDIVAIDVPAGATGERLLLVETSDGRLWPTRVDVVPEVDHLTRIPLDFTVPIGANDGRIQRIECFTARHRDRLVSAGAWSFDVAGGLNFQIVRPVDYAGYMTCVVVRSAQSGVRRLRVGAAGYSEEFEIEFR